MFEMSNINVVIKT